MNNLVKCICLLAGFLAAGHAARAADAPSEVWNFDSSQVSTPVGEDAKAREVYKVVMQLASAWNGHSIEGYLAYFWVSPKLVIVEDGEIAIGWDQLRAKYLNGLPDPSLMGQFEAQRTQVQMLGPDLAYVLLWWDMLMGRPPKKVIGTSTLVVRQFPEGWKIIAAHTQSLEP